MNDVETVALVGGGHAFGKTHGPAGGCGPGLKPSEDPLNSWQGTCGTGKGVDTFTSGFEGPWTSNPTQWDNEYFKNLVNYAWDNHTIASGATQWRVTNDSAVTAPFANSTGEQPIMMTTADVSLIYDADYQAIVHDFAQDQTHLDEEFSKAWYKLMTRDMGPVSRCLGNMLPEEPQAFQDSLPESADSLADFDAVRGRIVTLLTTENDSVTPLVDGSYGPLMVRLAWRCAGTFRVSDYQGGCNGARIRGTEQLGWAVNSGLDKALELLDPIKTEFGNGLSWADLIVLAGTTALEEAGAPKMQFCGGRVDFDYANSEDVVSPALEYLNNENIVRGNFNATIDDMEQYSLLLNLDAREYTALMGGLALGRLDLVPGFSTGKRTNDPTTLTAEYFENLLTETWTQTDTLYEANSLSMLRSDLLLVASAETLAAVQDYAGDEEMFLSDLSDVWTKMMNADRFDGPTGNVCEDDVYKRDSDSENGDESSKAVTGLVVVACLLGLLVLVLVVLLVTRARRDRKPAKQTRQTAQAQCVSTNDHCEMADVRNVA